MSGEFLDTNILIYAFSNDPKAAVAERVLARRWTISVQCLNGFVNVARRKLRMTWEELGQALDLIRILCPIITPIHFGRHDDAVRLMERHGFSMFDALIVASAVAARCDKLWSEDMQNGMVIERQLTIVNPFASNLPSL